MKQPDRHYFHVERSFDILQDACTNCVLNPWNETYTRRQSYRLWRRRAKLRLLIPSFPPRRAGFEPGSGRVRFVVDKEVLEQVSSEYFGFPCQSLFHQLLHNHHHLSSGAGTGGQTVAAVPSGLSLTPLITIINIMKACAILEVASSVLAVVKSQATIQDRSYDNVLVGRAYCITYEASILVKWRHSGEKPAPSDTRSLSTTKRTKEFWDWTRAVKFTFRCLIAWAVERTLILHAILLCMS
jgi:hypothetical protein